MSWPDPAEFDQPMTPAQLWERKEQIGKLSPARVMAAYLKAHAECKTNGEELPPAKAIQELVATWHCMWKRRRNKWWTSR